MRKIKLQKIVGNFLLIQKGLAMFEQYKILGNICFCEQIFYRKQSLGAPEPCKSQPFVLVSRKSERRFMYDRLIVYSIWRKQN